MEATQLPISGWLGRAVRYVSTVEYYLAKERMNLTICDKWMDPEGIMLSKISQTEKDKYRMISLICGI